MEKDRVIENEMEFEADIDSEEEYVPRNRIVAAKETIYDKTNLTVGQVDKFIAFCVGAIVLIIMLGLNM